MNKYKIKKLHGVDYIYRQIPNGEEFMSDIATCRKLNKLTKELEALTEQLEQMKEKVDYPYEEIAEMQQQLEQVKTVLSGIKWVSADKDNMEFSATITCWQKEALEGKS